jgi:hypothetical protein
MKQNKKDGSTKLLQKTEQKIQRKIKPRIRQRAFKNEELSINKIKKDYEKFKLPPNFSKRLS